MEPRDNNHKIFEALKFYLLATQLKDLIRSWRKVWNVKKERLESVAEHIYGTCILAIAIHSEFEVQIDIHKVILMLVVHELGEVITGDLTLYDENYENKFEQEMKAVEQILGNLNKKIFYQEILKEFNEKTTPEAEFAYLCDKLEADIQIKRYEEEGALDLYGARNTTALEDERVQQMITERGAKTVADVRIEYDKQLYTSSPTFLAILEYVQKHRLQDITF